MVGNQAIATAVGFVPVVGDVGIAIFKTNFRNAALLEEYLRVRGEEFLKAQAERVEDPAVVKPGADKRKPRRYSKNPHHRIASSTSADRPRRFLSLKLLPRMNPNRQNPGPLPNLKAGTVRKAKARRRASKVYPDTTTYQTTGRSLAHKYQNHSRLYQFTRHTITWPLIPQYTTL